MSNTTYTFKHDWTDNTIHQLTKIELAEAIKAQRPLWNVKSTLPKQELVDLGIRLRNELKEKQSQIDFENQLAHEQQLAKDWVHPRYARALELLVAEFGSIYSTHHEENVKRGQAIAADWTRLSWVAQDIGFSGHLSRMASQHADWFTEVLEKKQMTIQQMKDAIDREAKQLTRRVLDWAVGNHSTNPVSNVMDEMELKAHQRMAKIWTRLVELFNDDMAAEESARYNVEHLNWL